MSLEAKLEGIEALLKEMRKQIEKLEERLKPEPLCFTYEEAAERLGVGPTKLKAMVRAGEIKKSYPLPGGDPMISLTELQRVAAPKAEQPKLERAQRAAAYTPIKRKRG